MSLHDTVDNLETKLNKQRYNKAWFNGIVCEHEFRDAFVVEFFKAQNYQSLVIDCNEYTHTGSSDFSMQDFVDNKIAEVLMQCPQHERPIIIMENFHHIQNAGEQSYIKMLMDMDGLFKAKTLHSESEQFIPVFFSSCYYYDYGISGRFPNQETWYITNRNICHVKSLEHVHAQIQDEQQANYARIRAQEDARLMDYDYADDIPNSAGYVGYDGSVQDTEEAKKKKNNSGYF
jgi:hypothetical protein